MSTSMLNHTLLSLIGIIVTTNAFISPFNLLNVHKYCSIHAALPSIVLPAHQFIWTLYKMKQMAMGSILIAEREHWTVCQQREHSRKWKYKINGKTLIPIIIRYDMKFSFLFWVKFSVKTPIPIIIRKYMKFSFPF